MHTSPAPTGSAGDREPVDAGEPRAVLVAEGEPQLSHLGAGAAHPAAPTRARRRRRRWPDAVAALVFALAGGLFVAGWSAARDGDLRVDRTGGLREAIADRSAQNLQLQAQNDALEARVATLREQATAGPALEAATARIAALEPMVGLTEVIGPGVRVVLEDADPPDPMPEDMTGDDYIVHQEDVQGVVNALWRGGASGVTVMGQRLISTSAVRCVGNTVILQGRVYSPPFIIEAVGPVADLEASLDADPAVRFFREWADVVGMRYEQVPLREAVLPAYSGPLSPQYARVA
ncbi:MAG: DUF881 domain-containing protein [Candidatus Nanopelagicales bacterium]|nr:DUF881 domain-containing protein [Candidatus Nanopelagicales bacterium]